VFVNGEAHDVRAWNRQLLDQGLDAEQIATKSYWSRGRANAEHGEPVRNEA
jgi:NADPH-dependent ferric siderophore reductase